MPSRNAAAAGRVANAPCAQTRLAPHLRRRPRARAAPSYACSSAFPFPLSIHLTSLACQCKLTFYPVRRVSPGRSGSSLAADAAAVWRRSLDVATFEHPETYTTTCLVVACHAKIFFLRTRIKSLPGAYAISPYEAKYPPATASFHVRRTQGTMPTSKSVSAFCARRPETGESDPRNGIHFSETLPDQYLHKPPDCGRSSSLEI